MTFYAPFAIPFIIGSTLMFAIIATKWLLWFMHLPKVDRRLVRHNFFTRKTLLATTEVVRESLLHARIFKVNPLLGYMHMSLAFGWFLLIMVGWIETIHYLGFEPIPLQGHVFFKYFIPLNAITQHHPIFEHLMDALLLFVLSGVALAWYKRLRSKAMGMRKTTKHVAFDRIALSALWFVFPARLVAESITTSIYGGNGFLTGSIGKLLSNTVPQEYLTLIYEPAWWFYSLALGIFFVALPFSRYMHIFTEIPLIYLRHWQLRPTSERKSYDNFEVEACSRCGICIDPCQLQSDLGINDTQSVYYLRDRRYNMLSLKVANNCLMCGRCETVCPVGINIATLRLNSRAKRRNIPNEGRYKYIKGIDRSEGKGRIGYFAGCMTPLTPGVQRSMEQIFNTVNEDVWYADKEGGVCCGRPLMLSGETDAARKMVAYNTDLIRKHDITTLVTSCPICLRVFKESYHLDGIKVLHHSEYIEHLIANGRLTLRQTNKNYTYHDPCELGRGLGIYDAPRNVISAVGNLRETEHNRERSLCCGSSLANTVINDAQQQTIAKRMTEELEATECDSIITSCPLCNKAIARAAMTKVEDIAEIVAKNLNAVN
ncbi:MAG: 4Fe-4S dicluster domain-containing protein [Alistipes sp.]|nr:4Fe-4S dicluster domain-containing protein [Alistipes sp.]